MKDFQDKLLKKADEIYLLKPNDLGSHRLTFTYHRLVSHLKIMPFIYIIPMSVVATVALYVFLGPLLVRLASLLQHGF